MCCFYTSKFCNEWHAIPNRTVGTDQKHNPDKYSTLYSNLIQSKYFIKRSVPTNPRSCCHVCLRESMIMSTNNPIIFRWMGHDGLALSIQCNGVPQNCRETYDWGPPVGTSLRRWSDQTIDIEWRKPQHSCQFNLECFPSNIKRFIVCIGRTQTSTLSCKTPAAAALLETVSINVNISLRPSVYPSYYV